MRGWIREFKLERFARITGRREDVARLPLGRGHRHRGLTCGSETIARAALEIMAADRPLISSDVGVMPDLLPPEALFPAGDVDAMTRLLTRAIDDVSFRQGLLRENDLTLSQLSGHDFLQRTLTLYEGFYD